MWKLGNASASQKVEKFGTPTHMSIRRSASMTTIPSLPTMRGCWLERTGKGKSLHACSRAHVYDPPLPQAEWQRAWEKWRGGPAAGFGGWKKKMVSLRRGSWPICWCVILDFAGSRDLSYHVEPKSSGTCLFHDMISMPSGEAKCLSEIQACRDIEHETDKLVSYVGCMCFWRSIFDYFSSIHLADELFHSIRAEALVALQSSPRKTWAMILRGRKPRRQVTTLRSYNGDMQNLGCWIFWMDLRYSKRKWHCNGSEWIGIV